MSFLAARSARNDAPSAKRPKTARELISLLIAGEPAEVPTARIADALEWLGDWKAGLRLDVAPGSAGYHLISASGIADA